MGGLHVAGADLGDVVTCAVGGAGSEAELSLCGVRRVGSLGFTYRTKTSSRSLRGSISKSTLLGILGGMQTHSDTSGQGEVHDETLAESTDDRSDCRHGEWYVEKELGGLGELAGGWEV